MTRCAPLLGLALSTLASAALAQSGPSTAGLTCEQAHALVNARGAIVLSTSGQTYDRYVRDQSFCFVGQVTKPDFVPTRSGTPCALDRCFDRTFQSDR